MRRRYLGVVVVAALAVSGLGATLAISKAKDAGMSSERLERIQPMIQRHIDGKDFSGAVTLVARNGKVVHFEAQALADVGAKKPMATGTLFRLASMTKSVTAVSILMLLEEGKLVLSDPVSTFVPEYKNRRSRYRNLVYQAISD